MEERDLDFEIGEYEKRLAAVRHEMRRRKVDVLLVDQFEHLVYMFGYLPTAARYQACLLPVEGAPHMIVRTLDLPTFHSQSWLTSYSAFADDEDPIEVTVRELRATMPARGSVAVEMDSNFLTVSRFAQLREALPHARFVDFAGVVADLRLIKSDAELGYLRRSAAIAEACLDRALDSVGEGCCERVPAAVAYDTAMRMGADNARVLIVASGGRSDGLHGRLGDRILTTGDILHLELLPQVRGYSSRIMRPTVIGVPSPHRQRVADRLVAIQDEQIAAMRPGIRAGEIDRIARDQILRDGLQQQYPQITGYTLGYHAQPRTSDHSRYFVGGSEWELAAGMVFHMYLGVQGMAISETVLVGDDGPERLTRADRTLFVR